MILKRLRLYNFRLFAERVFEPEAGLNLLTGPNGSGKTSILEALHLLSAARSFRAKKESELCRWSQSDCKIEGTLETQNRHPRSLSLSWQRRDGEWKKQAGFQGDSVARLADFLGCIPLSLFTPADLALVSGAPAVRRRYLDLMLSKMSPLHLQDLSRLKAVLASRNALLRQGRPRRETRPWDQMLFGLSLTVGRRREELVTSLNDICQGYFARLTSKEKGIQLSYKRCWPQDWDEFQARLDELHSREVMRGATMLSPHKDDLEIQRQERSLRTYGSQGEQRLVALCLRLAEAGQLALQKSEKSILLLDDAFSELDPERKQRLMAILPDFSQVFLTSASPLDMTDVPHSLHAFSADHG